MKKILVISIIFLFVGMGFQPAFAVENRVTIDKVEDCDCQTVVSDVELNRIGKSIDSIDVYTKLLSLYSKSNPEFKELSEEITKRISGLKGRIQQIEDEPPLILNCILLLMVFLPVWGIQKFFGDIYSNLPNQNSIFANIIWALGVSFFFLALYIAWGADNIGCEWPEIFNPYSENSLNIPLNDIIN